MLAASGNSLPDRAYPKLGRTRERMHVVSVGKFASRVGIWVACAGLAACSSPDPAENTEGGGAASDGGASGNGAMGGSHASAGASSVASPGCEHVIVPSSELYSSDGSTPSAIAAWKGELYLLTGGGMSQTVRVTDRATLKEVARVADDDRVDLTPSRLVVDAQGFFFNGRQDGTKRLLGVPFAGGDGVRIADLTDSNDILDSWFVSDDSALYYAADDDTGKMLKSAPRRLEAATAPTLLTDYTAFYQGLVGLGRGRCGGFRGPRVPRGGDREARQSFGELDEGTFVVVGKTVYFHDVDSNDDDHIFSVPTTGGTPTRLLDTHSVRHLASDGKTLFVEGSCGIHAVPRSAVQSVPR